MFASSIQKAKPYINKKNKNIQYFPHSFTQLLHFLGRKKKDLKKKTFFITIMNIKSWVKLWENTKIRLKSFTTEKKFKLTSILFLRLSEKPIDLIKNPIIRIVCSVRVGLMVRRKFRPLGAQFEPLGIDFRLLGVNFGTLGVDVWHLRVNF